MRSTQKTKGIIQNLGINEKGEDGEKKAPEIGIGSKDFTFIERPNWGIHQMERKHPNNHKKQCDGMKKKTNAPWFCT